MLKKITSIEALNEIYGKPAETSLWKEIDHINEHYQLFIEASPFLVLATYGQKGVDCSPRGDPAGFIRVLDRKTLLIPDRRGNNRLDSLRNIVGNPEVGLIFLVPNAGETIRVSGVAEILIDKKLCQSFAMKGKPANSVLKVTVEKAYFQCQKALARSKLWQSSSYPERAELPTAGEMVEQFSKDKATEFDGEAYDRDYPERMKRTIY